MNAPILVLGGAGMLGHKMYQRLSHVFPNTWCTVRQTRDDPVIAAVDLFDSPRVITGVDLLDDRCQHRVLHDVRPAVIVNCVGLIKQRPEARASELCTEVNGVLPHRLARSAAEIDARVIHFSTDCVFNGTRGGYRESDVPDAHDPYGRSKAQGELTSPHTLTLRTSIIGRELQHNASLLDWFLGHDGSVNGFTRVWWSGVTTNYLSELVATIISDHPTLSGLYHLATPRISKYELLIRLARAYERQIEIVPTDQPVLDRSLDGARLTNALGYPPPDWDQLLAELAGDDTPYEAWRSKRMVNAC